MAVSNIPKKKQLTEKMGMEITVQDLQKKIKINPRQIKKIAQTILKTLKITQATLSLVFVSSQKIRALNRKYLNRTYATDVLAFDLRDEFASKQSAKKNISGDVFISTDAVLQNSKAFGQEAHDELALYVIHGILHLAGYDDTNPTAKKKMQKKEQEIFSPLLYRLRASLIQK